MIVGLIAIERPVVKSIVLGKLAVIVVQLIGAGEGRMLTSNHRIRRITADGLAAPAPRDYLAAIAVGVHIDEVLSRLHDGERQVGRVDFIGILIVDVAHTDDQRSLRQTNLCCPVARFEQGNRSVCAEAERGRSEVNLGARIFIGPETVTGHQRTVACCGNPVVLSAGLEGNGTLYET